MAERPERLSKDDLNFLFGLLSKQTMKQSKRSTKEKNAHDKPFFDYEKILFDTLQQRKHIWIKKATGLGITEFTLRCMAGFV
jgi:ATP adenylyltransferase/5',5'''-P-1,P-4-tetraphosphate phosphorylase II